MIYVVDVKTGESISEMMGDVTSVAEQFLKDRVRLGDTCSLITKPYGYLLVNLLPTGKREPLLEIRKTPRVKKFPVALKASLWTIGILVGLVLVVGYCVLDALMGADTAQRQKQLLNTFGKSEPIPPLSKLLLSFLN